MKRAQHGKLVVRNEQAWRGYEPKDAWMREIGRVLNSQSAHMHTYCRYGTVAHRLGVPKALKQAYQAHMVCGPT